MRRLIFTLFIVITCAVAQSCDGNIDTDNGSLTINNNTASNIIVRYDTEVDGYGYVTIESRAVTIGPGNERRIFIDTLFWDADVEVEYNGDSKMYDIDFDLDGRERLSVEPWHFPSSMSSPG